MSSVFVKDGRFYVIKKDNFESIEKLNERGWFVAQIAPQTKAEYDEAVRLSRIWVNIKFDKCKYSKSVTDLLPTSI